MAASHQRRIRNFPTLKSRRFRWSLYWPLIVAGLVTTPAPATVLAAESSVTSLQQSERGAPVVIPSPRNKIRVGVRKDAEPFSYLKPSRSDNHILPGYSGYIVEICRTVLRDLVESDTFHEYEVEIVPVKASDRFVKLVDRQLDLLCGPDSITTERLRLYNVSYPVFLSGIVRVKLPLDRMPRSRHCLPILGLVAGTTSEQAGIQAMLEADQFGRFAPAIKQYLQLKAEPEGQPYKTTLLQTWERYVAKLGVGVKGTGTTVMHSGEVDIPPESVRTDECPTGFTDGPVIAYDTHATGLKDLCSGKILYYMGDVDIVKRNLPANCDHLDFSQKTFTKEAYGIYFRKPPRTAYRDLSEAEQWDAVLYSEFNRLLILQMQSAERLLEIQYREEFGTAEMAADLEMFFNAMQFATDY